MANIIKLFLATVLICLGTVVSASTSSSQYPDLDKYVSNLLEHTFAILKNDQLSVQEKTDQSEELLSNNLDLNWMAVYTLGRNRRTLDMNQLNDYIEAYKHYVINSYGSSVKLYDGQQVKIQQITQLTESDTTEFSVQTLFIKESTGQQVSVEYRVRKVQDGSFKVFDVVTEGISLIQSQHSEFNGIFANYGFDKLISILRTRAEQAETGTPEKASVKASAGAIAQPASPSSAAAK